MNKEQQIEELKKVMCEEYGKECNDCPCADCANSMIAERLYNAGYRKTFTSDFASETQKAFKEGYLKGIKEVLEQLYQHCFELADPYSDSDETFGSCDTDYILYTANTYGVEIEK